MMSEAKMPLEVIVEFDKVVKPSDYKGLSREKVLAWLDHTRQPYVVTNILYHGDGTSGAYDDDGHRVSRNGQRYN